MDAGLNLLSALTLLGAVQGVFLSVALVNTSGGDRRANRLLALLTFTFSIDLAEEFLYQLGVFVAHPHLLNVLAPIDLLYGPLVFLYVRQLTDPGRSARPYWHFLPVLAGAVALVPFFLLDGAAKLTLTDALRRGHSPGDSSPDSGLALYALTLFVLGTLAQLGLYLVFSIRRLARHSRNIRNQFSYIERINLRWLRNLLLGLGCIFLLYLSDQFFPDLLDMNILGDLITVVVVVLIYGMGYMGLRQPVIFTGSLSPEPSIATPADGAEVGKYRRSGLDKEQSRAFLEELTDHMRSERPYLEGDLALPHLAQRLGISPNYLSQTINEQLAVNFYDFVNGYRVEEAKRLMREDQEQRAKILSIALDSGFNSKSAFYTAFKKQTSMTPTQYRQTLQP